MGFELVQVRLLGQTRRTLQIMAEPADPNRVMDVEDCADISRAISAILDVHDPIPGAYTLEVTSPGIDRPLVKLGDYARFAGHLARLEVEPDIEGRTRFKATIKAVDGEDIVIEQDGQEFRVPYPSIRKARLVLTDALIKVAQQAHEARLAAQDESPEGGV